MLQEVRPFFTDKQLMVKADSPYFQFSKAGRHRSVGRSLGYANTSRVQEGSGQGHREEEKKNIDASKWQTGSRCRRCWRRGSQASMHMLNSRCVSSEDWHLVWELLGLVLLL